MKRFLIYLIIVSLLSPIFLPPELAMAYQEVQERNNVPADELLKTPTAPTSSPQAVSTERVELEENRSVNHKEYLNPDGTFTAEVHADPIHFEDENGILQEISNDIVPDTENDAFELTNQANNIQVKFPEEATDSKSIKKIIVDDMEIEIIPQEASDAQAKVEGEEVTYEGLFPSTEVVYSVLSNGVKEDIILLNDTAPTSYSFALDTKGLTPKETGFGNIVFLDSEGKEVLHAAKPFAVDAQDVLTEEAHQSLRQENGQWFLDLTLDEDWLKEEGRAFPVVLDPTITLTEGDIFDTFVSSLHPNTNFYGRNFLVVGRNAEHGQTRSLIRFSFPPLQSSASITSASFELDQYVANSATSTIDVHEANIPWASTSVTYNTNVQPKGAAIASRTSNAVGVWSFPVTSAVKGWYEGKELNQGFLLKARDENSDRKGFHASRVSDPTKSPKLIINYTVDPLGIEDFWSYDSEVNVHNGNLVLASADTILEGRGVPTVISRSYNSRQPENHGYGVGWNINQNLSLTFNKVEQSNIMVFTDGDGSKHTFTKDRFGNWNSPPGVHFDATGGSVNDTTIQIKDQSQTIYTFSKENGLLESVTDASQNKTTYTYTAENKLRTITDASGRTINFVYSSTGLLERISGSEIPTIRYTYANNRLQSVETVSKAGQVLQKESYEYNTSNQLIGIRDAKNHLTSIQYLSGRVSRITNTVTVDNRTETYLKRFAYQPLSDGMKTTVTDEKGTVTIYETNGFGNVIRLKENANGDFRESLFEWDNNYKLTKLTNPKLQSTVLSYDANGNLTKVTDPASNTQIMQYDAKSNMIQASSFSGVTNKYTFDATSNQVASYSPLAGSEQSTYNNHGNVMATTSAISAGDNLVLNHGFETWTTTPPYWSSTGSVTRGGVYVNGTNSARMDGVSTMTSEFFPVAESATYNFSWYIRTTGVTGNATARVIWYDADKRQIATVPNLAGARGTNEWQRKGTRSTAPASAAFAKIQLQTDSGSSWFDNIQVEEGNFVNEHNFVHNAGFEQGIDVKGDPVSWTLKRTTDAQDGVQKIDGQHVLALKGHSTTDKYYAQYMANISGKAGSLLSIAGSAKVEGATKVGDVYLQVRFDLVGGGYRWASLPIDIENQSDWSDAEGMVRAPVDYKGVAIFVRYKNGTGTAYFDDIEVGAASSTNALMSHYNIVQNGSFEVDLNADGKADFWTTQASSGATYGVTTEGGFTGNAAGTITQTANAEASFISAPLEPIRAGKTYTASSVVSGQELGDATAFIAIELYSSTGAKLGREEIQRPINKLDYWTPLYVQMSEQRAKQIHASATHMRVVVGSKGRFTGTMLVDNVRLDDQISRDSYAYDAKGNYLIEETDGLGRKVTYTNDARGNITRINFSKSGVFTNYVYDELDRVTSVSDHRLRFNLSHDANGNIAQIEYRPATSSSVFSTVSQHHDELDRLTRTVDQLGAETRFAYEPNGTLKQVTYPTGGQIHYAYNAFDELTRVSYGGTDTRTWDYEYDKSGNQTKATQNGSLVTTYSYDSLDRVTREEYPAVNGTRNTLTYTYNEDGEVETYTHSRVGQVRFAHDASGKSNSAEGPQEQRMDYMYDESGGIKKAFLKYKSESFSTYYDYNPVGQPSRIRQENKHGDVVSDEQLTFDENGHITEVRSLSGARVTYEYDNDYQLRKETHRNAAGAITLEQSYEYDFLGNRLAKTVGAARTTYTYDKANQLLQQGSLTYTHDHVGNTTSRGDTNFVYNTDRELTEVKRAGATIATYDYNHHGMRTKKVTGSRTEHYYYTGKDLAYITDGQNRIRSSFVRDALGQLMTYTDHTGASPKTYLYVLNHRGDVLGLRDEDGIMVVTYTYDAYGNIINQTGNGLTGDGRLLREANPFRYASYVYDEETSLYYVQTRYYDADTGRFITRDIVADTNLYIYADNNPVNFVDPDGRVPIPLIIFLAKAGFKAYTAYSTYKAIKNDPSMKNILLSLMPGGKITRMGGKKILAFAKGNKGGGKGSIFGKWVNVSKNKNWTRHFGSMNDFLKKNGYTVGPARNTFDMQKKIVYKNGKPVGEIHLGQPQYIGNNTKNSMSGGFYPSHYQRYRSGTTKLSNNHIYFKP